jgi:salicylate hydroxylase
MNTTPDCDVAIVGGGIGGLTLAASLARSSLSVRVFEQDSELREIGAGIALSGNATRLLERLDIRVDQVANMPPTLELRSWRNGESLWSHPLGEWYRREMGAPYLTLHRATLQRLLAEAVPSECIELDRRVVDLSDFGSGVRLRFEHGHDVHARIAVGVDGILSTVRRFVCGPVAPKQSGEIGLRGVIPVGRASDVPTPASLHIWCGPDTHAVFYGLDDGRLINLLLVYRPRQSPTWTATSNRVFAARDEALQILYDYAWDTRILDLVGSIEGEISLWALADLPRLPRWHRGGVVLLGDAAHAPLPHQGQGGGMAVEDAYTLGALLAAAPPNDLTSAFATFENLRKRRTELVQAYTRAAGRAYKLDGEASATRDTRWPNLPNRIGWIHRHQVEQFLPSVEEKPVPRGGTSRP